MTHFDRNFWVTSLATGARLQAGLPQTVCAASEVMFVDPGVPDVAAILGNLRAGVDAIMLHRASPAAKQMAAVLAGRRDLDAVHVVAHGGPGRVRLRGRRMVGRDALARRARPSLDWGGARRRRGAQALGLRDRAGRGRRGLRARARWSRRRGSCCRDRARGGGGEGRDVGALRAGGDCAVAADRGGGEELL